MTTLAYSRRGKGATLVLLHGLGSSRQAWNPVIPALSEHFDIIAIDLPGFGDSPSLPAGVEPLPATLAVSVADLLDELSIINPHLAGNSLGGWVALELAQLVPAASLTLLSPAGLWRKHTPYYCRVSLRTSRWLAAHATTVLARLVNHRLGRLLVLGQVLGRPLRIEPEHARAAIRDLASCPGFHATLEATLHRRYEAGAPIETPVTLAFGSRDWLLRPRQSRHVDQLPPNSRLTTLPRCGHVPMADDPAAIAAVITAAAGRDRVALSELVDARHA